MPLIITGGAGGGGTGDISGPGSSTDNAIPRWDGTGGDTLQNSSATIDDNGVIGAPNIDGDWVDVASATTVDLSAVYSKHIRITGTTTITGFTGLSNGDDRFIRFAGVLQLTHNGTSFILETGGNITTAANDRMIVSGLGSNNALGFMYHRADGTPLKLNAFYGSDGTTRLNVPYEAKLTGSVYTFTNTAAAVTGGTTSPSLTLAVAGTYLINAQLQLAYAGATVATETATIKLRRTNNTAADIGASLVYDLPASTTLTQTAGFPGLSQLYVATAGDIVTLFANVSAGLGAGTITAEAGGTWISAFRLFE